MTFSSLSSLDAVRLRRFIAQERREVWDQLSNSSVRSQWWPNAVITSVLGGEVQSQRLSNGRLAVFSGTVDAFVEGHALGFLWSETGQDISTSVLITLSSALRGTEVDIVEVGFAAFESNAERISEAEQEWSDLLAQLAARFD